MGSGGKDISWLALVVIGVGGAICLGIGVIIIRWFMGKVRQVRAAYPAAKVAWDKAMARWGVSYYCNRDDIVVDPATGETSRPQDMKQYLYA